MTCAIIERNNLFNKIYLNILLNVRIDYSSSLETQAWEQDLNPNPRFPQAAGPMDQRASCLCSPEVKSLQADTKNVGSYGKTGQTKKINAPNEGLIKAPNGGTKMTTISFMNLKSMLVANQEPSPEGGAGLQPNLMTTALEQDNQVANLRFLTNERTPSSSAIFPPLNLSTQFPRAHPSQCLDEPPMENIKFRSGVLYRPKNPVLQTYCHF
ncbi:hypothetical protein DSO57_1027780 [Entomophthora muscae]|uniref:Uncharacterized protein n=1 Tax=Entomophthora muscae TaxID=34485 RepID=A0ACC2SEN4_9FUNG|nr:hypothetical protein DSO57_1027780 [Entomophthora muscae]